MPITYEAAKKEITAAKQFLSSEGAGNFKESYQQRKKNKQGDLSAWVEQQLQGLAEIRGGIGEALAQDAGNQEAIGHSKWVEQQIASLQQAKAEITPKAPKSTIQASIGELGSRTSSGTPTPDTSQVSGRVKAAKDILRNSGDAKNKYELRSNEPEHTIVTSIRLKQDYKEDNTDGHVKDLNNMLQAFVKGRDPAKEGEPILISGEDAKSRAILMALCKQHDLKYEVAPPETKQLDETKDANIIAVIKIAAPVKTSTADNTLAPDEAKQATPPSPPPMPAKLAVKPVAVTPVTPDSTATTPAAKTTRDERDTSKTAQDRAAATPTTASRDAPSKRAPIDSAILAQANVDVAIAKPTVSTTSAGAKTDAMSDELISALMSSPGSPAVSSSAVLGDAAAAKVPEEKPIMGASTVASDAAKSAKSTAPEPFVSDAPKSKDVTASDDAGPVVNASVVAPPPPPPPPPNRATTRGASGPISSASIAARTVPGNLPFNASDLEAGGKQLRKVGANVSHPTLEQEAPNLT